MAPARRAEKAILTPGGRRGLVQPRTRAVFEPIYFHQAARSWSRSRRRRRGGNLQRHAAGLSHAPHARHASFLQGTGRTLTIFLAAKGAAGEGLPNLLIFLTVLSANLAVLNFLPIPLLDGGLMVLLLYEAIRGKPANERVQVALTYVGLAFIIVLTLWVCGLDFGLIPRR